ncbi:RNA dependent RNA polymerase-domain-containing protein [Mycena amicta]|nr:RNA dependent RNA polymerase-domain-containing protein [Mycena amicta]
MLQPATILGKRKDHDSGTPVRPKPFKVPKLDPCLDKDAPVIISHSPVHQRLLNSLKIPFGVQFEIHRLALRHGFDALDLTLLDDLKGKNNSVAIPSVPGLFGQTETSVEDGAFAKEIAAKAPWAELDLEDRYLSRNPLAGLGNFSETEGWFGGKAHFKGNIQSGYKIALKPPELGTSSRFARRFGSGRFLTLSITKQLLNQGEKLIDFLRRPFILAGLVFRAFDAKDGNVFLISTNEIVEGSRINPHRTISGLFSLSDFWDWHNRLVLDEKQSMAKWTARFALGRSNSVPVLRLNEGAIGEIPDLKSETGSDMTDGAGLVNKAALRLIFHKLELDAWPTAIQVRVAGAKGLLVMAPEDIQETPKIWLRPSQVKVKHNLKELGNDPVLHTIDLLRTSHCRTNCRLSVETIINLAENGVPTSVFLKLVETAMVNLVTPLITWEGENAMTDLWYAVARTGGVIAARLARQETVLARQKGYSEREVEDDDEEDTENQPQSTAWWVDEISGCPSSLEETVLGLLDSGFCPQTCSVLRSKLEKVVDGCLNRYIGSYRIDLPVGMSATAFLVPDPYGVLEEGQFFLKSTHFDFVAKDGLPTEVLSGPALITRHPCKLPTDVQKWTAVDRPELRFLTDVIVLSTKGARRAADFLGGGDYDGDKGLVIWEPEIVATFKNAPLEYSLEPAHVAGAFSKKVETVGDFLLRTQKLSLEETLREKQSYCLNALREIAVVGQYSNWHMHATYTLGYTHPETIRLAYMFCKTLDGSKTGLQVLPSVYNADKRAFDKRPPAWKEGAKKVQQGDQTNMLNLQRGRDLGPFIMDELFRLTDRWTRTTWGHKLKEDVNCRFRNRQPHVIDDDLTAPWLAFAEKEKTRMELQNEQNAKIIALATHAQNNDKLKETAAEVLSAVKRSVPSDMDLIVEHVEVVYTKHKSKIDRNFSKLKIERRQDILRELSGEFASGVAKLSMDQDQAARLMASYAYWYDCEQHKSRYNAWTRFPWDVAYRELCLIKTKASKTMKPVASTFYNRFSMRMARSRA